VIGIVLFVVSRAPAISTVAPAACISNATGCLRFPVISGNNLTGDSFALPDDFVGDPVLVIIPFDEAQQQSAQGWLPLARELAATHPGFAYYNVPIFPDIAAPIRVLIRSGMLLAIPDPQLQALTITAFLANRDQFLAALDIPNPDTMQVFLLNARGELLWRGTGGFTEEQGAALTRFFDQSP
jgi:hypothetical protein